jgi:hypothetical protein
VIGEVDVQRRDRDLAVAGGVEIGARPASRASPAGPIQYRVSPRGLTWRITGSLACAGRVG